MKVVSRNCKGLGSTKKIEAMKDLICISTPKILLVWETKMEELDFLQASHLLWKNGNGIVVSARGASGGIGTLWNSANFDLTFSSLSTHCIFTTLCHKSSGLLVSIINLYVPVLFSEKNKKIVGKVFRIS